MYASLRSFADDTRLIKRIEYMSDVKLLQIDLYNVIDWSEKNNMELHQDKFVLIQHNVPNSDIKLLINLPFIIFDQNYMTADGSMLGPTDNVKDLGVIITPQISWSEHIRYIVKKATKSASWSLSVFRYRDHHTMLTLYKSLVRSHLEYCCPLWNPHGNQSDIKLLEGVQRSFTAKILGYGDMNYWDRLASLKLSSLQRRRERYILIYMWKILHKIVPNSIDVNWHHNDRRGIRATVPNIPTSKSKLSAYDNSFMVIGPRLWNIIPSDCTTSPNLRSFKSNLQKYLDTIPDLPPVGNYVTKNCNSLLDWALERQRSGGWRR